MTWRPTRPVHVGVLAAVVALGFVGVRWAVAADRDVSRFVVAGSDFVDARTVDPAIHVFRGTGYDGQFYWRLGVDPADLDTGRTRGVRLDSEIRAGRIAYPLAAWGVALGHPGLVAWSLVLANCLAVGCVAGFAAAFAADRRLAPVWGLLVAMSSGLVMSLSRDLCEVVMVAALVGGALAVGRRRPAWAALAWSVAVLSHEQSLVVVGAYAAVRVVGLVRSRARPTAADAAWAVPVAVFAAWQVACRLAIGSFPILGSAGKNTDLPFVGLLPELRQWVTLDLSRQELLVLPQLALVVALVVVAAVRARRLDPADRWLVVALAATLLVPATLSRNVWQGPAELRTIVIVPTFAVLCLLAARRPPPTWLTAGVGAVWLATVALRAVAI